MICSYPKLCSNRLDNSRFVSAENIDIDPPLSKPLNEFLSSGSQPVNQTKNSDRFPLECDREDRPSFPA